MSTATDTSKTSTKTGQIAREWLNKHLPLQVMKSGAGYYIGTSDDGGPVSRESIEYWRKEAEAEEALRTGDWTQKEEP